MRWTALLALVACTPEPQRPAESQPVAIGIQATQDSPFRLECQLPFDPQTWVVMGQVYRDKGVMIMIPASLAAVREGLVKCRLTGDGKVNLSLSWWPPITD